MPARPAAQESKSGADEPLSRLGRGHSLREFGSYRHDMQFSAASQLRGIDLKAERVRADLTQAELAARLGVSTSRIANVEGAYRPPATIVERFLAALVADPDVGPAEPN